MEKIDAIILAGGLGTRLREVIKDLPKVLAPVNSRPFLDILLDRLHQSGCIHKVIIAVGYMAEKIIELYQEEAKYNFEILFSIEKNLLGTGGAIKRALLGTETENVLVLNGDSYVEVDISQLIKFHLSKNASIAIVLRGVSDVQSYGRAEIDDQFRLISFEEKNGSGYAGLINAGAYLMKRNLFDSVAKDQEISFEREILPDLTKGNAYAYIISGRFVDIGIPETYLLADKFFKDGY